MRTFTRLFGDGKHGQAERIQTFRGPACQTTFSSRRNTPLYRLKTPSHHLALVRISRWPKDWIPRRPRGSQGFRHATITTWLSRAARACAHPPRALLPPSLPAALAVGRAAYPAPLRSTGAVAVAGHRPLHQNSARAPSGSAHPTHGTPAHPLSATDPGSRLSAALHQ